MKRKPLLIGLVAITMSGAFILLCNLAVVFKTTPVPLSYQQTTQAGSNAKKSIELLSSKNGSTASLDQSNIETQTGTAPTIFYASQSSRTSSTLSVRERLQVFNLDSFEDLPGFLSGTDINGRVREDSSGNLIKDKPLKRLIKHFQLLLGEGYTKAEVKALLDIYFEQQVSENAAAEAKSFAHRYFEYQDHVKAAAAEYGYSNHGIDYQLDTMLDLLAKRQELRRHYFTDEELEVYFVDLEIYETHQLEAHKVLKNQFLSYEEKKDRVRELDANLPLKIQIDRRNIFATDHIKDIKSKSVQSDNSETSLIEQYESNFGTEAAQRLLNIRQDELTWNEKRKEYLALRETAHKKVELAEEDRRAYLNNSIQTQIGLTDSEIKRMQALDRIDELSRTPSN